jgi:dolichyl-phosphate-mannose-protein mannosyltransferase
MSDSPPPGVRQRAPKKKAAAEKAPSASAPALGSEDELLQKKVHSVPVKAQSQLGHKLGLLVVTVLAFVTRFWKISHPNEVVFDEVHFGKVWFPRGGLARWAGD